MKSAITFLVAALATSALFGAEPEAPPKELVQYVLDSRHQGMKDTALKGTAMAAGWPAAVVDQALAYVNKVETAENATSGTPHPDTVARIPAQVTPVVPQQARTAQSKPETPAIPANLSVPEDYQIGAGDVLQISVWKEPDASVPSVVVRPDGKVAMPLLKEVEVAGLTPRQVERAITERLSQFINTPDVTVVVTAINSKKVYVVGAAKKEGPLAYTYRMSVMQAISEAGGLTDFAKRKKIYVIRTENGKEYRLPFNYDEVVRGENMEQNIPLLPGDTLVIPH